MWSRLGDVTLNPGEFCFAGEGTRLRTLLGSCVSITLWHPRLRVGGMCHYMLPSRGGREAGAVLDGRYADEAMLLFLDELALLGTEPWEYEVKIFGGGNQFPAAVCSVRLDVSRGNIAAGLRLLHLHRFTLAAGHLGGTGFRRLWFDTATGAVRLNHVDRLELEPVELVGER